MPAILNQGRTAIRDSLKTLITHVAVAEDQTAFSAAQTAVNPTGAGGVLIKTSTETDIDAFTFDAQLSINGDAEFTNQTIFTISVLDGPTRTDALTRSVRSQGIGVQAGDTFTVGARITVEDNSV